MRLRLRGQTIRLRLDQPDIDRLADVGEVSECLSLAAETERRWWYRVKLDQQSERLTVELDARGLTVRLPASATGWLSSDDEGIYGEHGGLNVSVEKNYRCLHRDPEDREERLTVDRPQPTKSD